MKQLLFVLCALACTTLSAQNMPEQDMSGQTMTKAPDEYTMSFSEPKTVTQKNIQIHLEVSESEAQEFGISTADLQNEIRTRLLLGQIQVQHNPNLPKLVLRIKSIKADRAVASFIQMAFFEEAQLKRNKGMLMALTWSQARLISGPADEVNKEIMQIVTNMTNNFILEYHKALI